MKKNLIAVALLVMFCFLLFNFFLKEKINKGYSSNTTWENFTGLDIKYHDAYENCISLLQNNDYFFDSEIDTSKISLEIISNLDSGKVQLFDIYTKMKDDFLEEDKEYLCFTIGEFFLIKLVCDPETNKIIGYLKEEACVLEEKYWTVYQNCVFLIKRFNSETPYIKKDIVSIDLLQDCEKGKIQLFKNNKKRYLFKPDKEYLCFTIGEPEYCVKLVCVPETNEVIGYIEDEFYYNIFVGTE
ncbi:MAG: hypothetical protein HFH68_10270 [Lachnospiraceae bacterium]|nr:hypothetical protein [Lachnospiraceae bacterium]